MRIKILKIVSLCLAIGLVLSGCNMVEKNADKINSKVVAEIGEEKILRGEILDMAVQQIAYYGLTEEFFETEDGINYFKEVAPLLLQQAIEGRLVLVKGQQLNIAADKAKIDETLQATKEYYETEEAYEKALEDAGLTEEEYIKEISESLLITAVQQELLKDVNITEEEVKAYYDENKGSYGEKDTAKARHILVGTKEAADEIIVMLEDGMDFSVLAKEKSQDDGSAIAGGELGEFMEGDMVEPFNNAVFEAEGPGLLHEAVESEFGYHVIEILEINRAEETPLEDIKDIVKEDALNARKQEEWKSIVEALKAEFNVKEYADRLF